MISDAVMWKNVWFKRLTDPKVKNPVLIEGLPGIGYVGKIAADYLVKVLNAKKITEVYSFHFYDQVIVGDDGVCRLPRNELYQGRWGGRDVLILVGDSQPPISDLEGHYLVFKEIFNYSVSLGCKLIVTLGGFQDAQVRIKPKVYVACTNDNLLKKLVSVENITLDRGGQGRIFGAAGLLLALAQLENMDGFSLLGTTLGTLEDYLAAYHVLAALSKILSLPLDLSGLEEKKNRTQSFLLDVKRRRKDYLERIEEPKPPEYIG